MDNPEKLATIRRKTQHNTHVSVGQVCQRVAAFLWFSLCIPFPPPIKHDSFDINWNIVCWTPHSGINILISLLFGKKKAKWYFLF